MARKAPKKTQSDSVKAVHNPLPHVRSIETTRQAGEHVLVAPEKPKQNNEEV